MAESLPVDPSSGDEVDRQGGRRLSRARRPDAEVIWREGFSDDPLGGVHRKKDLRGAHGKIRVDKLPDVAGDPLLGVVVSVSRRTTEVEVLEGERTGEVILCSYSPRLVLGRESLVAVGDRALIHPMPGSGWLLTSLEPRRTKLSRPGPDARGHLDIVVAANLDVLVIVVAVDRPRFHPRFVDRFLVAAQLGLVAPALFLNKCDLDTEEPDLDTYRRLGVPVFRGSAETGEGLDLLKEFVAGKWVAFAGISGVGKSSLIRSMIPGSNAEVGEVRSKDGRGRHTTTRAQVYRLGENSRIVDTPGIRELAMHRLKAQEVQLYFTDFDIHFGHCRFNDCLHTREPGCAVSKAVSEGTIDSDRYASYLRIVESLQ